mgnify:CR=1 FL=1
MTNKFFVSPELPRYLQNFRGTCTVSSDLRNGFNNITLFKNILGVFKRLSCFSRFCFCISYIFREISILSSFLLPISRELALASKTRIVILITIDTSLSIFIRLSAIDETLRRISIFELKHSIILFKQIIIFLSF